MSNRVPFDWATSTVPAAEMTEGPYYGRGGPVRSDIRGDRRGHDLVLAIKVVDATNGTPIPGCKLDIWHCDAQGRYSGYEFDPDVQPDNVDYRMPDLDEDYLRGAQTTDADGVAEFLTIFPGWYATRTTHMHLKVFVGDDCILTTQLYVAEQQLDRIYGTEEEYRRKVERDTHNKTDIVLAKAQNSIEGCWIELFEESGRLRGESVLAVDPSARSMRKEVPKGFRPPVGGMAHDKPVR